jgi:hypothetical protein
MGRDLTRRQTFGAEQQHHVVNAAKAALMLTHNRRVKRAITITRNIDVDRADISDHRLRARPVPRVPTVSALCSVLRVTEMAVHLTFEAGLQHPFGGSTR